jgi:hypothetical protein
MIFGFCDECHAILQDDGGGHFEFCDTVQGIVTQILEEITVTVPTQPGVIDEWGAITAHAVQRLRAPKTPPPPPQVFINLAQESYLGRVDPENPEGERLHVLRYDFGSIERAAKAAKHLRDAGLHTMPKTSVTVVVDPDKDGSGAVLSWRAGTRKGRGV